jgi:lysophospholipid acyltransferase (LPLAT)-like uncharacterized protein
MKLRHPALIRAASLAGAWAIRGWIGSLRFHYEPLGGDLDPRRPGLRGRYIYAFWHEGMLLPALHYARRDIRVLISQHADGQLIAEICERLGFGTVRGSSTRGGAEAVREVLKAGGKWHFAITPDGPRGPRRTLQTGAVFLAAHSGMPVVPMGIGFDRAWRMKSWDRFAVPRPGSRGVLVTGTPIEVPARLGRRDLEHYRRKMESAINDATRIAEDLAESGERD